MDRYADMLQPNGQPRAGWAPLWSYLNVSSRAELDYAHQQVQQELRQQAITGFADEIDDVDDGRNWHLDSIPYILPHDDFAFLSQQIVKRATSIEAILRDLHGERRLTHETWFPRRLLAENPSFIRPLTQINQTFLTCYAVDLVRDPSGIWRLLADRCQAPFGLGYALQNRLVIGRSLTNVFEQTRASSLAPFFRELSHALEHTTANAQPRIALLSSEPLGYTSYEQAFLARYLHIDLVSAHDLTVRNRQVYTKTLGGLQPIDVLFRWVEDNWCDPLFLRPDSLGGVPGLVDAVAAGNVVIANGLGCGLIDAPPMLSLVSPCAQALGYDAGQLPTVDVYWSEHATTLMDDRVLMRAWRDLQQQAVVTADCSPEDRQSWQQRLRHHSSSYVQVERMYPSLAPAWDDGHLSDHGIVLRLFAIADGNGSFSVMPGGLVRSSPRSRAVYHGIRHGGTSKDVWVPIPEGETPRAPIRMPARSIFRGGTNLLSSRLDALFWCGRQAERIDHLCRLIRTSVSVERAIIFGDREQSVEALTQLAQPYLTGTEQPTTAIGRLTELTYGMSPAVSLIGTSQEFIRLASSIRDLFPADVWRHLQLLQSELADYRINQKARLSSLSQISDAILSQMLAISSSIDDGMMRDEAWCFVELGRRIERAIILCRLLDTFASVNDRDDLLLALQVADCEITWRVRFGFHIQAEGMAKLLVHSREHPRSLSFLCDAIEERLRQLIPPTIGSVEMLLQHLDQVRALVYDNCFVEAGELLSHMTDMIDLRWFSHAIPAQHINSWPPEQPEFLPYVPGGDRE